MEHREADGDALLHGCDLGRHGVAGGEGAVKEVIVGVGVGGLDVVDEGRERSGVALAELLGEPLGEVAEGEEDGEGPQGAEEVEEQVAHGCALGRDVTAHRCHEGGDGGAYVGAEHEGT